MKTPEDVTAWFKALARYGLTTKTAVARALGVGRPKLDAMLEGGADRKHGLAMDGLEAELRSGWVARPGALDALARIELTDWAGSIRKQLETMDTHEMRDWRRWAPADALPWILERTLARTWDHAPARVREGVVTEPGQPHYDAIAGAVATAAVVFVRHGRGSVVVGRAPSLGQMMHDAGVADVFVGRMLAAHPGEPIGRTHWHEVAVRMERTRLDTLLEMALVFDDAGQAARRDVAGHYYSAQARKHTETRS